MTPIADMVEKMLSTGIPPEMIALAVKTAEEHAAQQARKSRDFAADKRRAWDRERKRKKAEIEKGPLSISKKGSIKEESISKKVRKKEKHARDEIESEFNLWYGGYRHKVGRAAAYRAFARARSKASLELLLSGRDKYIRTKPPERAWCNPATWLNQERWKDEPDETVVSQPRYDPKREMRDAMQQLRAFAAGAGANGGRPSSGIGGSNVVRLPKPDGAQSAGLSNSLDGGNGALSRLGRADSG